MIRVGIVGAADPRATWFLAAARRRRAGVRIVGVSDPDEVARDQLAGLHGLPGWADHRTLLAEAQPSLVAIACPDPVPVVLDALRHDLDVVVAPPLAGHPDELTAIAELADTVGRRVTLALTYRGHPATRTAVELINRLGRVGLVSLVLGGEAAAGTHQLSIMEGLDLFQWLTGTTARSLTSIDDGHRARADDPDDLRRAFGELILVAETDDGAAGFEVRHQPGPVDRPEVIQVYGEAGAIEWDPRTGILRSALDEQAPVTLSCGRPDQPEWVLNNLIRKSQPVISTAYSLELMRVLLSQDRTEHLT